MKMPDTIDISMFAPCGINCMVCYKHCDQRKPCPGCLNSDDGKPEHCRKCKIKDCINQRGITYCFECLDYPCKQMKYMEKSYLTRYQASLMQNSLSVKKNGPEEFMKQQKLEFTCPDCGGIISVHDRICSECRAVPPSFTQRS